ncbi:MAG: ferrous iron transporter B [bacterium]|nr:ferrous iron transporter B [bacterium]
MSDSATQHGPLEVVKGAAARRADPAVKCVALVGNPNAGKTTLFNRLTGLRAKTANFPGTTVEHRVGRARIAEMDTEIVDLPGLYSLNSATIEERLTREVLTGKLPDQKRADVVVLLLDATKLERNLYLASQVLEVGLPTVVALNMVDLARKNGLKIDVGRLSAELGCPVVPLVARDGDGVDALRRRVAEVLAKPETAAPAPPSCSCAGCPHQGRYEWAEGIGSRCVGGSPTAGGEKTERIDRVLTHPLVGVAAFVSVMFAVFAMIFWIAQYPMGWIESGFGWAASWFGQRMAEGDLRSFVVDGLVGGVGGVLVFLPQICILFFFLSLLEDTGYLARAAFVMDRLMRRVGLPGKAFVPMLSAHACALPAIMSARVVDDRRDRLVTILVLPLLTCSARIPVYAMVTALLFPHRPMLAALVFTGAYCLGIVAALGTAFVFKRTLLPGETRPLVLELPSYRIPGLRTALLTTLDRALLFVRNAGTIILLVSVALWALATYPKSEPPAAAEALFAQAAAQRAAGDVAAAGETELDAERMVSQSALAHSLAGRLGRVIEPAIRPLGFEWQLGVGVVSSFAAREVIVSTLAVVYGLGDAAGDEDPTGLYDTLRRARRTDGSAVFTLGTCLSLLVFYVLAMQCLPTLAVTRRETNSWRWPAFQLLYMSALAYVGALITYQVVQRFWA